MGGRRHRLPGPGAADVLDAGDEVADFAGPELGHGHGHRGADADLLDLVVGPRLHEAQPVRRRQGSVHHPDGADHAAVLVVGRVEDQGPQRGVRVAGRCRYAGHDGVEQGRHPLPGLGRDVEDVGGGQAQDALDLGRRPFRVGRRQVDLVQHGHDLEVVLQGLVTVGQGLGLDALGGVDQQHGTLAGSQRPADLVAEVDMARGVDEVERVLGPRHPDVLGLDGDSPLPLDVHRVQVLLAHLAGIDGPGQFEDAVGQRRLAVVDMADDGEVADTVDGEHGVPSVPKAGGRPLPRRLPDALGVARAPSGPIRPELLSFLVSR